MPTIVSVDPGSSFIKAAAGSKSVRFPSVAVSVNGPGDNNITVEGKSYIVGEEALLLQGRPRDVPHAGEEYHGGDLQYVLICEALRQLGVESCDTMLMGLPYFLRHNKDARNRVIERMRKFHWRDAQGEHTVEVPAPLVVPQGGGALWGWISKHRAEGMGLVCAIDIGGHTTDVFTLAAGASLEQDTEVQGASGSVGVNVHGFYQALIERLKRLPGTGLHTKTFNYFSIMRAIEDKKMHLRHNGKLIPIDAPFAETCKEFTEDLLRAAQDTVGDRWSELDKILLTGGGAPLIDPAIWDDTRVVHLDATSNVSGQMTFYREAQGDEAVA